MEKLWDTSLVLRTYMGVNKAQMKHESQTQATQKLGFIKGVDKGLITGAVKD